MGRSIKIPIYCNIGEIGTYIELKNIDKPCYHCNKRRACAYKGLMSSIHIYDILRYSNMHIPKQIIVTKRDLNSEIVLDMMYRVLESMIGDKHGEGK